MHRWSHGPEGGAGLTSLVTTPITNAWKGKVFAKATAVHTRTRPACADLALEPEAEGASDLEPQTGPA